MQLGAPEYIVGKTVTQGAVFLMVVVPVKVVLRKWWYWC